MILCITLNPCLDKTLTVPPWHPGDLVRGVAIREVVGGKGNNVARALQRLGQAPVPVTFLGGPTGTACEVMLRQDDGLHPIVIPTAAPTRVIQTIRTESTDDQTAFFDPDPAITPSEVDEMIQRVEKALRGNVAALTLSGSSPSPATHGLYSDFIATANARKIPVFLDTYGPPLEAIWGFWPTAIQLNRREAAAHLRKPTLSDADADALLHKWARHGVACAIITDGPNPVAVQLRGKRYRAIPPGSRRSTRSDRATRSWPGWSTAGSSGSTPSRSSATPWPAPSPTPWSGMPGPSIRPRSHEGPKRSWLRASLAGRETSLQSRGRDQARLKSSHASPS